MKLSDHDRFVLANIELNAEVPVSTLAKKLGLSANTLHHTIDRFLESGIIRYSPWIDPYPLGYRLFNIFFSVNQAPTAHREKLLGLITRHPQVTWLRELGGSYQYCISFVTHHVQELMNFLEGLALQCPNMIRRKAIMDQLSLVMFPAKFLAPKVVGPALLVRGGQLSKIDGDVTDHRVLAALITGAHSVRDIARKIGAPASTVDYRLQRLRKAGVLKGFVYLRNFSKMDTVELKLNITVTNRTRKLRDALLQFSMRHPNIIYWVEMVGGWDFEIDVEVNAVGDVSVVCEDLRARFGSEIDSIEVVPMLRELKDACFPTYFKGEIVR